MIGFDNTTMAQSEFVGLSTIDYARQDMGGRTLRLLKERMTDSARPRQEVTLEPELIPRSTTTK